ncbi:MAG: acyl--CoA ligase [Oscillospiraceae bacterium]|jgi:long-chain acyl-CoA synthetase|nr:acyl--CoA ligase [Oscillospiraceae bacterium]
MIETLQYNCYEYFLKWTESYGEYVAIERFGKKVTRSEFLRQVDGFAAYMQKELGLKHGDIYTVFLPTTVQSFVAFYALSKIGVIANFVHPLSPPENLKEIMIETGSKGIMIFDILSKKYIDVINEVGVPCLVCRSSDYASPARKAGLKVFEGGFRLTLPKLRNRDVFSRAVRLYPAAPGLRGNGGDIAVYMNGGGTTGKSKTIKLTSKALNEIAYKISKIDGISEKGIEASILVLPLFHAFGLCVGMHTAMCNGARLIPMMQFNEKNFNKLMRKHKVVFLVGIPGMYKKIMHEKHFDGSHLGNLRLLFCGGDDASQTFLDEFNSYLEKNGAPGRLYQGYGLTEVVAVCCANTAAAHCPGSIGRPLEDVTMEIWDDERNPVPNGEIGEIVISGSTIMEGYFTLDKPADEGLYTDKNGKKWVLSGDLGYRNDDGYIFFAGRKKRLIIISGYNVYPGDIEKRVETLPFVREACAVQGYLSGKPIVRLFVSLRDKGDEEAYKKTIIETCQKHLSQFSVPREIVVMDELPRTHMKKVDFMSLTEKHPNAKKAAETQAIG